MARATPDRAALAAYHRELTTRFLARRCGCGAAAGIVCVGLPLEPDRHWCLPCASWLAMPVERSVDSGHA